LAQVLKSASYATGGFGKWGLGDIGTPGVPWKHGFDQFFGYLHQIHAHFYYPPYLWDNDKKFPLAGNDSGKRTTCSHDVIASKALDFIRSHSSQQLIFCYVPFTIPHMEYLVPQDSIDEY
jgi:arylsulfatase A